MKTFYSKFLKLFNWILHPISIFVVTQAVLVAVLILWIQWFSDRSEKLESLAHMLGRTYEFAGTDITTLVVGITLIALVLAGTIVQFIFLVKQKDLNNQQRSFLSSVTHELRSPLASLQLMLETMKVRQVDQATSSTMINMMTTDTERLSRLVDQILISSRIDRGLFSFDPAEPVDMGQLVEQITKRLGYLDPTLEKRLILDNKPTKQYVSAKQGLTLILGNLIENAVKYSPKDTPIYIDFQEVGDELTIAVRDEGHGLDRSERRRIFKMFHRGNEVVEKAIPGTGLGLFIVRQTLKMLGGRVWAESPGRNKGSTFFISIPRHEVP